MFKLLEGQSDRYFQKFTSFDYCLGNDAFSFNSHSAWSLGI